jgi:glutamate transport system permease protein
LNVLVQNAGAFANGFRTTLALTLASFAGALAIGLVVASMRVSPVAPLRAAGTAYVETIRNIPLLVLLVLFYSGFTKLGIQYSEFNSAVIVLSVYTAAFVAEAIRSGVNTVAQGQAEAARAIGLTFPQSLRLVVLPQALRAVVAPIGNIFIALVKNTALASAISVMELGFFYRKLTNDTSQPVPILLATAVCYLALALTGSWIFGRLEQKVAIKR